MGYFYGSNAQIPGLLDYISKGSAARSTPAKTATTTTPAKATPATTTAAQASSASAASAQSTGAEDCATENFNCMDRCQRQFGGDPGQFSQCMDGCDQAYKNCVGTGGGTGGGGGDTTPGGGDPTCSKGNKFPLPADGICPPGYVKLHYPDGTVENSSIPETGYNGPVCACLKYCESLGRSGVDCTTTGGTAAPALGEFKWPKEVEEYYKLLTSAGTNYLTNPGYSKAVLSAMFGTDFDKVRALETGTRNTMQGLLGREGLLGTGTAGRTMAQTAWNTENNIANLMRQLMIDQEAKKAQDIAAANTLFGSVTGYNQIGEAINAARRGEGQASLAMLMQYILNLMSGWNK